MRRLFISITGALVVVAVLLPPWRIAWVPQPAGEGPVALEVAWAGFHFWTFASERPSKVIAWDGPGTGGHVPMTGEPEILLPLWLGLVALTAGGAWLAARRPRSAT